MSTRTLFSVIFHSVSEGLPLLTPEILLGIAVISGNIGGTPLLHLLLRSLKISPYPTSLRVTMNPAPSPEASSPPPVITKAHTGELPFRAQYCARGGFFSIE
ncbi:hypothetical protein CVT26_015538 [Gymnopilus dilepis]|uniref:Uncharacterized protein n=1 Tax=Gymnopilus dilepis TaxID=231916 RepID=A0A409YD43_9AGAR|nr:hypothetical protein CVT26_015538 [Gymnopilus dilepis]